MTFGGDLLKPPIFERFSTGLLVGVVFALLLAWAVDKEVATAYKENWVEIFGILAALIAAVVALFGVQRQIRVQTDQAEAERLAQLKASVSVLPLVLSDFVRMSEECFEISLDAVSEVRNAGRRDEFLSRSRVDDAALEVLRDCIRFSDNVSASWLSLLVRQYQLCRSRFESLVSGDHIILPINQHSMACDWAVLRATANHLFEFSRGEVAEVAEYLDPSEVRLPISSRHFGRASYSDCSDYMSRKRGRFGMGSAKEIFG